MSYANRPMGDYKTYGYAGDPGFLSSLWKGFKKVAGFIPGPIGTIARVATGIAAGGAIVKMTQPQMPSLPGTLGGAISFPGGTTISTAYTGTALVPTVPGGARYPTVRTGGIPGGPGMAGAMPSGYHYAKDGSGRLVRNRRMNVANPRALRKAMRRVQGFEKLAKRTIQFTRRVRMKKRKTS